jgi:hypothetical protein
MSEPPRPKSGDPEPLPFPDSLCHGCAAPPKYVKSARSVFILCPLEPDGAKYPRQPVRSCPCYRQRAPK